MKSLSRCSRCGLPEAYPGVQFGPDGVCNYCLYYDVYRDREAAISAELRRGFLKTIRKIRRERRPYHCVVAYSGGKDSSFLLKYLVEAHGLKVAAHVLDNGFISPAALRNIRRVTDRLKVKCIITRPPMPLMKAVFTHVLTRETPFPKELLAMLSPLCVACQGMVFGTTIRAARRLKAPLMFIGYTPGQYPVISLENYLKVNSCVFFSSEVYRDDPLDVIKIGRDPLHELFGSDIDPYFFPGQYIKEGESVPKVLFPFHGLIEYDEDAIYRELAALGWEKPDDTDPCSTNCMINALGNYACVRKLGYHPYAGELSFLVRTGRMTLGAALEAERVDEGCVAMRHSLEMLGLDREDILK
ncbi:MAG: hypothetical protein JW807_02480 [Spirochaetes bacterium]|nr:hypothetical protein [Spirochaetota bacterium]